MRRTRIAALTSAGALAIVTGCGTSSSQPTPSATPAVSPAAEPQTAPSPGAELPGVIVDVGDTPEGLVVDDRHSEVVAALRKPAALALVGLTASHPVKQVPLPGRARHLRLAGPDGPLLVAAEDANELLTVTLPAGTVTRRYPTGKNPHDAVAVTGRIWVTDELAGSVTALAPTSAASQGPAQDTTLPAGVQPGGLAAAGDRVAVADVRGNQLHVYDAKSVKEIAVLPAGAGPTHVVQVGPTTVAVADTRGDAVLLYDLSGTPRLLQRVSVPGGPYGLAADLTRHRLWVALSGRNQVVGFTVNDATLAANGSSYPTVQQPNSLAVIAKSGAVVVAGATPLGPLQFLPAP